MSLPSTIEKHARIAGLPALAALLFLLSGCATITPSSNHVAHVAQDSATLKNAGVDPTLAQKTVSGAPLEIEEIETLSKQNAPAGPIVRAIERSDVVYHLTTEAIDRLREAEVENEVIDALLATPHKAEAYPGASHPKYYPTSSYRYFPRRSYYRYRGHHGHHGYRGYRGYRCY